MHRRAAMAVLLLAGEIVPLCGQGSGQEVWRATLSEAERARTERHFGEAERLFRSALEQARALEPDVAPAATTYNNLAGLFQDMGRCSPAVQGYQRSLELWEEAGARGEPYLLRTANHLVAAYL